jgi:hypothetical protein
MSLNELIAQGAQFKAPDLLGQYATMQTLQHGMQQNALNQLTMDEKRRAIEDQNRLRSAYAGITDYNDPTILNKIGAISPKAAMDMGEYQRKNAETRSKTMKEGADAVARALENSRTALDGVTTPEQYMQWHLANHSDPVLGEWLKQRGVTPESAMKRIQESLTSPEKFQSLLKESKIGALKTMENNFSNFDTGQQIGVNVMPKYGNGAAQVVPGTVMNKQMTPGAAEANDTARKNVALRERELEFNQDPVRQAAMAAAKATAAAEKPMTPLQQQAFRKTMVADQDSVKAATSTANELEKVADELLGNPEKKIQAHPGLGGITGYAALVPSLPSGDAAKAQQKLETFKGKIAALGRSLASQNGKLGNMAVQEWKVVADAVENIDPKAGNLEEQMRNVVRQAREFADRHKEKYDLTYENADALLGEKSPAATASPQGTPANPTPINAWADWAKNTGRK